MTVKNITKTETKMVTKVVEEKVEKAIGVAYHSDSSDRGIRFTPSSSMAGRFTFTISNPDGSNELAVVLKANDAKAFLEAALRFARQ